jgi:hypothetical protein
MKLAAQQAIMSDLYLAATASARARAAARAAGDAAAERSKRDIAAEYAAAYDEQLRQKAEAEATVRAVEMQRADELRAAAAREADEARSAWAAKRAAKAAYARTLDAQQRARAASISEGSAPGPRSSLMGVLRASAADSVATAAPAPTLSAQPPQAPSAVTAAKARRAAARDGAAESVASLMGHRGPAVAAPALPLPAPVAPPVSEPLPAPAAADAAPPAAPQCAEAPATPSKATTRSRRDVPPGASPLYMKPRSDERALLARISGAKTGRPRAGATKAPSAARPGPALGSPPPVPVIAIIKPSSTVASLTSPLALQLAHAHKVQERAMRAPGASPLKGGPLGADMAVNETPAKAAVPTNMYKLTPSTGRKTAKPLRFTTAADVKRREAATRQQAASAAMSAGATALRNA